MYQNCLDVQLFFSNVRLPFFYGFGVHDLKVIAVYSWEISTVWFINNVGLLLGFLAKSCVLFVNHLQLFLLDRLGVLTTDIIGPNGK